MKNNYEEFMDKINEIKKLKEKPTLLLHTCCALCFSSAYLQLKDYFKITVFFYNPNIYPLEEYEKRKQEVLRMIQIFNNEYHTEVQFIEKIDTFDDYKSKKIHSKGCLDCFHLRLLKSFMYANENHFDYMTTTLTVGRLKNSKLLNQIGQSLQSMFDPTQYLISDFKKNGGIDLSLQCKEKYHIYAQCYCGCEPYYQEKSQ